MSGPAELCTAVIYSRAGRGWLDPVIEQARRSVPARRIVGTDQWSVFYDQFSDTVDLAVIDSAGLSSESIDRQVRHIEMLGTRRVVIVGSELPGVPVGRPRTPGVFRNRIVTDEVLALLLTLTGLELDDGISAFGIPRSP